MFKISHFIFKINNSTFYKKPLLLVAGEINPDIDPATFFSLYFERNDLN